MKIELKIDGKESEFCEIVKKYSNGDYQLSRKGRKRMELESNFDTDRLRDKYMDKYLWINVYLKDSKGHEYAIVRRVED